MTIIIVIVSLAILLWVLGLRLLILFAAKQITSEMTPPAEYFTEYDITINADDDVQSITHDGLTMTIPGNYVERETSLENTLIYNLPLEDTTDTESVVFMEASDLSDMNLFGEENMAAYTGGFLDKFAVNKLKKGFDDLGHGLPDSAYNTFKSTSLLSTDDYSFWNWKKGFAYVVSGAIKNTTWIADKNYIYETEKICGIIHVRELTERDYKYYIVVDMFSTDDLDTAHGLLIKSDSLEQAYAMINSIVIE